MNLATLGHGWPQFKSQSVAKLKSGHSGTGAPLATLATVPRTTTPHTHACVRTRNFACFEVWQVWQVWPKLTLRSSLPESALATLWIIFKNGVWPTVATLLGCTQGAFDFHEVFP